MKRTFVQIREGAVSVCDEKGQSPMIVSYYSEVNPGGPGGMRYFKRQKDSRSGRIMVRTQVSKEEYDRNTSNALR